MKIKSNIFILLSSIMMIWLVIVGWYILENWNKKRTSNYIETSSVQELPHFWDVYLNMDKLDERSKGKALENVNGYFTNQFVIASSTLSNESLFELVKKYTKIYPIAAEDGVGILLEVIDEIDPETKKQLDTLKNENGIDVFVNNNYIGSGLRNKRNY